MKFGDIGAKLAAFSVKNMLQRSTDALNLSEFLQAPSQIVVESVEDFRALPDRERAARTVEWLKRMGRFAEGMAPREMEDHEIVAALLLSNGSMKREDVIQPGDTVTFSGRKFLVK